jgi:hypothetical protein
VLEAHDVADVPGNPDRSSPGHPRRDDWLADDLARANDFWRRARRLERRGDGGLARTLAAAGKVGRPTW